MPRIRPSSIVAAHSVLGQLCIDWRLRDRRSGLVNYGLSYGPLHLLQADRKTDARRRLNGLTFLARSTHAAGSVDRLAVAWRWLDSESTGEHYPSLLKRYLERFPGRNALPAARTLVRLCAAVGWVRTNFQVARLNYDAHLQRMDAGCLSIQTAYLGFTHAASTAGEHEVLAQTIDRHEQGGHMGQAKQPMVTMALDFHQRVMRGDRSPEMQRQLSDFLQLLTKDFGPDHGIVISLSVSAACMVSDSDSRIAQLEELLAHARQARGNDGRATLLCARNLATCYSNLKRYDDAIPLLRESIASTERQRGRRHPHYLKDQYILAVALHNGWYCEEAVALAEKVEAVRSEVLGHDHADTKKAATLVRVSRKRRKKARDKSAKQEER